MNFDETTAQEARQQGRQAYYDGREADEDLFGNVLALHRAWVAGWREAWADDEEAAEMKNGSTL